MPTEPEPFVGVDDGAYMFRDLSSAAYELQPPYRLGDLDRALAKLVWFRNFDYPPGYWHAELARRIEERRVRHWPSLLRRRVRLAWLRSRWSTVVEVIRGKHYCDDY